MSSDRDPNPPILPVRATVQGVPWDLPTDRGRRVETAAIRATDAIMKMQRSKGDPLVRSDVKAAVLTACDSCAPAEPVDKPLTPRQKVAAQAVLGVVIALFIGCLVIPVCAWVYFNGVVPLYEWAFPWL